MSVSLIVLIPLVLLGVVTALCFVGCKLPTSGLSTPYEQAILGNDFLVAYWPLDDIAGSTTAQDSSTNKFNGTYNGAKPGHTGFIPGDSVDNDVSTCASFDGGFVQVPFHVQLNTPPFTLEAWVLPQWDPDEGAFRNVVTSATGASFTGFGLFATPDNLWAASVGNGTQYTETMPLPGSSPAVVFNGVGNYLAVTFDGTNLNLFVNPSDGTASASASIMPNTFSPAQAPQSFVIGRGLTNTTPPTPTEPFDGLIQDVAFYSQVLDSSTIQGDFQTGATTD